jgi:hypothetical protein
VRASLIVTAFNEGSLLAKTVETCVEAIDGLDCELVVADTWMLAA